MSYPYFQSFGAWRKASSTWRVCGDSRSGDSMTQLYICRDRYVKSFDSSLRNADHSPGTINGMNRAASACPLRQNGENQSRRPGFVVVNDVGGLHHVRPPGLILAR